MAQFGANPAGNSTVGLDLGSSTNNGAGSQAVGAIEITSARVNTLTVSNSSAGTNGTLTLNGATVNSINNVILRSSSVNAFNLANGATKTMALALANTTDNVVVVDGAGNINISSSISGASKHLTVQGSGSGDLILSGTNNFDGGIAVAGSGKLRLGAAAALPTTGDISVSGDGRLRIAVVGTYGANTQTVTFSPNGTTNPALDLQTSNIAVTLSANVRLNANTRLESNGASGAVTLSGNLSGSGALVKQAAGNLILSGTGNTATGGTQVGNGTITVNSGSSLGTGDLTLAQSSTNTTTVSFNNATQSIGNLSSTWTAVTGTIAQTLTLGGTALTVNQTTNGTFGTGAVVGLTSVISGTGSFTKAGAATLTLSSANTYTGGTAVSGGALVLVGGSALADSGAVNVNGGTLMLNAAETVGAVTLTSGTISGSVLTGSSYAVQNGSVSAVLAGSGITLSKTGAGTVTLSGVNTYTGATSVGAGTLSVNGSTAAGSAVTVTGGTLSGTGTVGGALTLNGGTIAPGNSPGTLTLSGNFTATSGTLSFELASPTSDKLVLSGSGITLTGNTGGAVAINLVDFDGSATTGTYTLISVVGSSISTSNWGLSAFTLVLPSNWSGFLAMSGNDLDFTLVPEPSAYATVVGTLALTVVGLSHRRRAERTK